MKNILQCFDILENSKHVSTPLAPHMKLGASLSPSSDEEQECMSRVPYANIVGSLLYAIVCTRPNISHAVEVVTIYA